jgi:hypothetical protein
MTYSQVYCSWCKSATAPLDDCQECKWARYWAKQEQMVYIRNYCAPPITEPLEPFVPDNRHERRKAAKQAARKNRRSK